MAHVSINEAENTLDYLRRACGFIKSYSGPIDWKWIAISLQGALYGSAICRIRGTDSDANTTYVTKEGQKKLIQIDKALERCKKKRYAATTSRGKVLSLSKAQKKAIDILVKTVRNNFEHFAPKTWVLETSGMPEVCKHVLQVIRYLLLDGVDYPLHLSESELDEIDELIKTAIQDLDRL